jgi:hypothetical protein
MNPEQICRKALLSQSGMGMAILGLAPMLAADDAIQDLSPRESHFTPKAKRIIHIFLNGAPSQVDTFDPKPMLDKYDGKELYLKYKTERPTGPGMKSPFSFKRYGQSGLPISEIFEELGEFADDLCVIRSMTTNVPNHERSILMMNCGEGGVIRPSLGSWLTYGLGSVNQNLPGYVTLIPDGKPTSGARNWQSAFLPGIFQSTYVNTKYRNVHTMMPNLRNEQMGPAFQKQQFDLLQELNQKHLQQRKQDSLLEARIQSYELGYRMQSSGSDAFDISKEPEHIRNMYGDNKQSRQLLIARRLIERGVRFVQVWHDQGQPWDSHDNIEKAHRKLGRESSPGIAALIRDLKQRGMLNDTLLVIGGEFGRTPTVELPRSGEVNKRTLGRDHNHHGFTTVLVGGGAKGGYAYGATDEFGFKAIENQVHVHDLHATILHLMGFDHERLTYRHAGREFRLTDVHGHVVKDIIA